MRDRDKVPSSWARKARKSISGIGTSASRVPNRAISSSGCCPHISDSRRFAATDSRWLRNAGIPSYGVSGLFSDPGKSGVHGLNEQVGVKELYDSKEFLYRLVKRLAGPAEK
jgi:acetylornithine deacetylase/succinyl-diaminopimelate desuccinylase-like protein